MEELVKTQLLKKELIEKFMRNYKKDGKDRKTSSYYSARLKLLNDYWTDFHDRHVQVWSLKPSETTEMSKSITEYFVEDVYSQVEQLFIHSSASIEESFKSDFPPSNLKGKKNQDHIEIGHSPSNEDVIRLPRLELPKFSGEYENWPSFYDLFKHLVHENSKLSKVRKLQYLKLHLDGEAQQLLRHFQVIESNYDAAWQLLIGRFDNKRVLVNTQLKLLLSLNNLNNDTSQGIKRILDTTEECLQQLRNLKVNVDSWDVFIVYITVQKLPTETRLLWEQGLSTRTDCQSWKELQTFLEGRFRALESIIDKSTKPFNNNQSYRSSRSTKSFSTTQTFHASTSTECIMCRQSHTIRQCPQFAALTQSKRFETVKSTGLCINCLGHGHLASACPSKHSCLQCQKRHHTLLHRGGKEEMTPKTPIKNHNSVVATPKMSAQAEPFVPPDTPSTSNFNSYVVNNTMENKDVLLATALVKVVTHFGNEQVLRALIDPGSQASFITETAVRHLRLPKEAIFANVSGLGNSTAGKVSHRVHIILKPHNNNKDIEFNVSSFVLKTLTHVLPNRTICGNQWVHIETFNLADPNYHRSGKIDLLLGAEIYAKIIELGLIKGHFGAPTAQNTALGWILTGEISRSQSNPTQIKTFHTKCELNTQLKLFWELEEVPSDKHYTNEEQRCEEFYNQNVKRNPDGRYEVQLPFVDDQPYLKLGKSRDIAISRLVHLENRFISNPELQKSYISCMNEYLSSGHMQEVTTTEEDHIVVRPNGQTTYSCSYLPHHAVVKESSSTTKLRVVFDASQTSKSGISLNEILLKGPTIQDDLAVLLLRWRKYPIAIMADVEKMYRQIRVAPSDTNYQRIVWRESSTLPIRDYSLVTVTFGTKCAPFLAIRTLKQLAEDSIKIYPIASDAIANDMYVDDLITGDFNIPKTLEKQQQIISCMESAGFKIRKWASNSKEVLEKLPLEFREIKLPFELDMDRNVKALGIRWNPAFDYFSFIFQLEEPKGILTKRRILTEIAKLYDPLGWLSPTTIIGKLLLQNLWLIGTEWDDPVNDEIRKKWLEFHQALKGINLIKIPRWLGILYSNQHIEIHGFSDASLKAYAAVVYVCVTENGKRKISLISAKSKVAPIKTVSLPRLELCGAHLLAKLVKYILDSIKIENFQLHAWTDSEIVIAWLRKHPSKWKTFVANRVSQIHELLGINVWKHVPSKENPADLATRGLCPTELEKCSLWWEGPHWLQLPDHHWPTGSQNTTTEHESRNIKSLHTEIQLEWDIITKYSSLTRLSRVISYCRRFIKNVKKSKEKREFAYLKSEEIEDALLLCIKKTQSCFFTKDIPLLQSGKMIPKSNPLLKLNPFMHTDELLRVGGRLENANLPYGEKHPIILPSKSHLTELIIRDAHYRTLHGGPQLMMAFLKKKYWILNCRNTIRQVIHACVTCFRYKTNLRQQLMGNLPAPRVNISRPFSHTGVDYCGPFNILRYKGRGAKSYKGYVAIFICFVTKAIHIELVSDMSADGFLAAFKRFISRRGLCSDLYSDCGSNFVGANVILCRQFKKLVESNANVIAAKLENEGIKWHFIPPGSPNFGGLWEAGVKSTKFHLKRIVGQSLLTFEEFNTLLTQIEACLNSRPLCEITHDLDDFTSLTPGHFIIGDTLISLPEPSLLNTNLHCLTRWHLVQHMYQSFWKRWSKEYLGRLQQRPKWNRIEPNLAIGDLVIMKDDRTSAAYWPMARIMEVHPGTDGIVRVVTLKTKEGVFKRSIAKVCALPINSRSANLP